MKLSMWMIANRLSSLDLELDIDENSPATLNSARRAYATNCVHVYQSGDCVVCNGEGNIIRIRNITETQAFEIIQSVFDYYEDWLERIMSAVRAKDYQALVDHAWQALQNPLILMDGNNRVLGISHKYDLKDMDQEWVYLCKFGYSSLNSVQKMRYNYGNIDFLHHGLQPYHFTPDSQMKFSGVSYCMYCNEVVCGRISLLAKDRPLNAGDYQLLQVIANILEPALSQSYHERFLHSSNVFYNLLFSEPYDELILDMQLKYQQWKRADTYQLALIRLREEDFPQDTHSFINLIARNLPSYITLRKKPYIIIFSNKEFSKDSEFLKFLQDILSNNPIQVGFSLPCSGINNCNYLFQQAKAALHYGNIMNPDGNVFHFSDYAIEYILAAPSFAGCLHACCPAVRKIWDSKHGSDPELFSTFKCYLDNERSVTKTSAELFVHRNTILYRIKKIQELLDEDLDNAYIRDYVRLSIRILELNEKSSADRSPME